MAHFLAFLLLVFLCVNSSYGCIDGERRALLEFKRNMKNVASSFTSWNDSDCCTWDRVECDENSGHVVTLSYFGYDDDYPRQTDVAWISNLTFLQTLDFNHFDLSGVHNLFQVLSRLPYLSELSLSSCMLTNTHISSAQINSTTFLSRIQHLDLRENSFEGPFPSFCQNMTSLVYLDLSMNKFNSSVPYWFGNLKNLQYIWLSGNSFDRIEGGMPMMLWNRCSLKSLDLSFNKFKNELLETHWSVSGCVGYELERLDLNSNSFYGSIPASIQSLSNLESLDLAFNNLNGIIPTSLGELSRLKYLSLGSNNLSGVLTEIHLTNLSKLKYFLISYNDHLTLKLKSSWVPSFQLEEIYMGPSKLVTIPQWIESQVHLRLLSLYNCSISGPIPDWLMSFENLIQLDLPNNFFYGPIPASVGNMSNLASLNLANNQLSGNVPDSLIKLVNLEELHLHQNLINGSIANTFCNVTMLQYLDLSGNLLSGEIPNCWQDFQLLNSLDVSSNELTGYIPGSLGRLSHLTSLHLNNNSLEGEIPLSLKNCKNLVILDLGENGFHGNIPAWIGHSFFDLEILRLRDNSFRGDIPFQLCQLPLLRILDIAENKLSNTIPRCLGNLTGMISPQKISKTYFPFGLDVVSMVLQGRATKYTSALKYLVSMDLSSNYLVGVIPEELTNLNGLYGLNLSFNHLTGKIPENIGNMKSLASLDFSRNQLSGSIPTSLSKLSFLSYLNLSYNNFSGQIPTGAQLQTLTDPSIYAGNPELCGGIISRKCSVDKLPSDDKDNDEDDKFDNMGFYIAVTLGYATGLLGVIGVLVFKKKWRYAYFRFADDTKDSIYVAVAVKMAYLKRKLGLNRVKV